MAKAASFLPKGYHTLTPQLALSNAARTIDWCKKAFGAEEIDQAEVEQRANEHFAKMAQASR